MIVLPDTEDHMIVSSFIWTKHWNVKDDRQTDLPWLLQWSALRVSQYGCAVKMTWRWGLVIKS